MMADLNSIVSQGTSAIVSVAYAGAVVKTTKSAFGGAKRYTKKKSKKKSMF